MEGSPSVNANNEVGSSLYLKVPSKLSSARSNPQVACIHPTPQLEVGTLSPSPALNRSRSTTPRIPLAELDQSTLPQRLFQSPSLPVQSATNNGTLKNGVSQGTINSTSVNSPFSTSTSPRSNVSSCSSTSPSYLLHTQLPHTISSRRDKRRQLETERQLIDLKQQVNQLGTMVYNRHMNDMGSNGWNSLHEQLEQAENERDELEALLQERQQELMAFKDSVASLNAEYMADLSTLKLESKALKDQLKEQEERYFLLNREHQKGLKTIKGLQGYIQTLPAEEEVKDLKIKLESRTEEIAELTIKSNESDGLILKLKEDFKNNERLRFDMEVELKELRENNEMLSNTVKLDEKRRYQARSHDKEDVELLLYDKEELKNENDKLKKLLEWKSKTFEKEQHKLEEQLRQTASLLAESNKQLQVNSSKLRESNGMCTSLKSDLKKKSEANATLESRLEKYGVEIQNLRSSTENNLRLDGYYNRLTSGIGSCIAELNTLSNLYEQIVGGGDPNVSILLGVREGAVPTVFVDKDISELTLEEKKELISEQLEEVKRVQGDIKVLRLKISERYAENLADNMTSCITQ